MKVKDNICNYCEKEKIKNGFPFCNPCSFKTKVETRESFRKSNNEKEKNKLRLKMRREIRLEIERINEQQFNKI